MLSHGISRFSTVQLTEDYHIDSRDGAGLSMPQSGSSGEAVVGRILQDFRDVSWGRNNR